jgi:hypothetical protein
MWLSFDLGPVVIVPTSLHLRPQHEAEPDCQGRDEPGQAGHPELGPLRAGYRPDVLGVDPEAREHAPPFVRCAHMLVDFRSNLAPPLERASSTPRPGPQVRAGGRVGTADGCVV